MHRSVWSEAACSTARSKKTQRLFLQQETGMTALPLTFGSPNLFIYPYRYNLLRPAATINSSLYCVLPQKDIASSVSNWINSKWPFCSLGLNEWVYFGFVWFFTSFSSIFFPFVIVGFFFPLLMKMGFQFDWLGFQLFICTISSRPESKADGWSVGTQHPAECSGSQGEPPVRG